MSPFHAAHRSRQWYTLHNYGGIEATGDPDLIAWARRVKAPWRVQRSIRAKRQEAAGHLDVFIRYEGAVR